jgi:Bacterial protein of unknown function (DUF885)
MSRSLTASLLAMMAAVLLIGCGESSTSPPLAQPPAAVVSPAPPAPKSAWPEFAGRFIEDYFHAQPFFAVQAGRHEFDGQMPDLSAAGIAAEVSRLHQMRSAASAFDPTALSPQARFEREYVLWVIDGDLFWLERARFPFTNPAWYIGQLDPDVYLNRDYAPLAKRVSGYIGYLRSIPRIAADIRANLHTPLPATFVERGIAGFGGFADFYRNDAPRMFAGVQDSTAQKDLADATAAAGDAMSSLKVWLQGQTQSATGDFALGEPLFLEMLRATERVDVPVAQLRSIGEADLDRNTEALKSACAQYLPGGTVRACIDKADADKPAAGPVEEARTQLTQLRDFVIARNVVSVPSDQQAQVALAPPYNRANFAYINVPGPYDKNVAYTYNIAPPDPTWSAKDRAAYIPAKGRLLYTSVHEVWPGHFLQFLHSNRNPSRVAALWVGYAYAEGWAHYCEEMMWEEGLGDGSPEQHIGQITSALLRDVRYLSAIGLHTGGMTVAESDRMFRERAYANPGGARQQAARGTYDPAYLKYTLGKLMIRKLRADWVAQQPGASAAGDPRRYWHDFHDKFLSYGGPPIPLVRAAMVGEGGSLF